jgi:hypothetical protein
MERAMGKVIVWVYPQRGISFGRGVDKASNVQVRYKGKRNKAQNTREMEMELVIIENPKKELYRVYDEYYIKKHAAESHNEAEEKKRRASRYIKKIEKIEIFYYIENQERFIDIPFPSKELKEICKTKEVGESFEYEGKLHKKDVKVTEQEAFEYKPSFVEVPISVGERWHVGEAQDLIASQFPRANTHYISLDSDEVLRCRFTEEEIYHTYVEEYYREPSDYHRGGWGYRKVFARKQYDFEASKESLKITESFREDCKRCDKDGNVYKESASGELNGNFGSGNSWSDKGYY